MKEKLVDQTLFESVAPVFKKWYGSVLRKCCMAIAGLNNANRVYDAAKYAEKGAVEDALLDSMGIKRIAHNSEVIKQFDGQPFITVSNHPYGHIDGISLIAEVIKYRPDYRVMVNWMLGLVDIMDDHFIGVNPYSSDVVEKSSLAGVKESIAHLKDGNALGFFPAGAISNPDKGNKLCDREWQAGVVKLIQKAKVPVIPVYISGCNSKFFYWLGKIDWRLRTLRLCHELNNKKNHTIELVFGKPIMPEEQSLYGDLAELGSFLKEKTYDLASSLR